MQSSPVTKANSLEELVQSPESLPLENGAPLSLRVCLQRLFEQGWKPDITSCGAARLVEETVLWLKSLQKATVPGQELSEVVQDLLHSFNKMVASTKEVEELRSMCEKKTDIANTTVEGRYQEAVEAAKALPPLEAERVINTKKQMLETWLGKTVELLKLEFDKLSARHVSIREQFEAKVLDVVTLAYDEYQDGKVKQVEVEGKEKEQESLGASLDAELELAFANLSLRTQPVPDSKQPTATEAFEALQQAVGDTLAKTSVPDALKEHVVAGIQDIFTTAFQPPKVAPQSPQPPLRRGNAADLGQPHPANVQAPASASGRNDKDPKVPREEGGQGADAAKTAPMPTVPPKTQVFEGGPAVAVSEQRLAAMSLQFERKDTSELEKSENEKGAVNIDGTMYYITPKGKLETREARDKRLAHNSYVKFSRSFDDSFLAAFSDQGLSE